MKILVTGANGFVGSHLVGWLSENTGHDVVPAVRHPSDAGGAQVVLDIGVRDQVEQVMKAVEPDAVINLAGQPSIPASWDIAPETFSTNLTGPSNLLAEIVGKPVRLLLIGSAHVYAPPSGATPLKETDPLLPTSPYGVSKIAQEMLSWVYHRQHGVNVVGTRSFNHAGPGQARGFALGDFCRQVVAIESGEQDPLMKVGWLDAERDLLDVRDVVRAYVALAEAGTSGEIYNVASGRAVTIRRLLDLLLDTAGLAGQVKIEESSTRRPGDPEVLIGDYSKLEQAVGWKPSIPIEQTVRDTLDSYRTASKET